MRALFAPIALAAVLAGPIHAEAPKFIKVDIVSKTMLGHHHDGDAEGPKEVHIRMPITLAKGILDMASDGEVKINGKQTKGMKVDQLVALLEGAKSGDLLLELTTDKGDVVKITVQ